MKKEKCESFQKSLKANLNNVRSKLKEQEQKEVFPPINRPQLRQRLAAEQRKQKCRDTFTRLKLKKKTSILPEPAAVPDAQLQSQSQSQTHPAAGVSEMSKQGLLSVQERYSPVKWLC